MGKARGFTLMEIIITVVIVGILMAIAIPSYQNHLKKGRRAQAQAFITQVAQKQQQYLLDARTYALGGTALTELGLTAPTDVSTYYTVTVTPAAPTVPPSFTVTAAPMGVQATDGTLSIDNTGAKKRMLSGVDHGW